MHQYLQDTEYATKNLIDLATAEEVQLRTLSTSLSDIEARFNSNWWDFTTSDMNDDFSEAHVMNAFVRAAKAKKEAQQLEPEIVTLRGRVAAHQQATQAISGAVLQIAKQGISLVHGGLSHAPQGRAIGSLYIRDIIWQGRNQSLHYEEGNFNVGVTNLFTTLVSEQGARFSLAVNPPLSRAKQILELLGWVDYAAYEQDMQTLLP